MTDDRLIQTLPAAVVDQIAAGEVVERPAHLIKELVENSIDAGATSVEVSFADGGRWVQVLDNGRGMSAEDLPKSLERFATSKIKESDDLWKLASFGFRGEALASISSVSRISLTSRRQQDQKGQKLVAEFGQIKSQDSVAGAIGTRVIVEDLFSNVPARLKFLKSSSAEGAQIKTMLKAMALSHPQVEFRVEENGKLIYLYPKASSHLERVQQVLEVKPLYEGSAIRGSVKARAFFADPHHVAKTSRQIWLFAQNRWIQDRSLQAAVIEAYRNLLMHGEYPIAAVFVEAAPDEIDVNIHPTKSAVKFVDPSLAFRAVAASLRESLEKAPWLKDRVAAPQVASSVSSSQVISHRDQVNNYDQKSSSMSFGENFRFQDPNMERTQYNAKSFSLQLASEQKDLREQFWKTTDQPQASEVISSFQSDCQVEVQSGNQEKYWSQLQILGQMNLTYIVCQSDKGMVLVDQHAAHERVAFERLMSSWKGGKIDVQEYLFPLALDLSSEKVEALLTQTTELARLGLHIEALGPQTIGVRAAPLLLKESIIAKVLEKMSQEIVDQGGSYQLEKSVADICATMACHSVVRAGQSLSPEQMRNLLIEMDQFPLSSFCPHGRPVSIEWGWGKIEKEFGRLV